MSFPAQKTMSATIADSATSTDAIDLGDNLLYAIGKGTGVEGTAITFTGSLTYGGTYRPIKTSAGVAVTLTCTSATSEIISVGDPRPFVGIPFIKVVMGTAQTGVGTLELYTLPV